MYQFLTAPLHVNRRCLNVEENNWPKCIIITFLKIALGPFHGTGKLRQMTGNGMRETGGRHVAKSHRLDLTK